VPPGRLTIDSEAVANSVEKVLIGGAPMLLGSSGRTYDS
jgi:hypothetical protein